MSVIDVASDARRYGILDSELLKGFPFGYVENLHARGVVPDDVFDRGLLPGFLACTNCNVFCDHVWYGELGVEGSVASVEQIPKPMNHWVLDGTVLVCVECGADLT